MKMLQLLFKFDQHLIKTSIEEIAKNCEPEVTELDIMRVLYRMKEEGKLEIIQGRNTKGINDLN